MEDLKSAMENMVKTEAEKSLADKKDRLKELYDNVKRDVRHSYEEVVDKFKSMVK